MLVLVILLEALLASDAALPTVAQQAWSIKAHRIANPISHPGVAATPTELRRLRRAWLAEGKQRDVLRKFVANADKQLQAELGFPIRGGQHNQWYQCVTCQRPLTTVDASKHRCDTCGRVSSGEPFDDVVFGRIHRANLTNARQAAWAYAITEQPKYAAFVARVLTGYASRYAKYPYHDTSAGKQPAGISGGHVFEQTLDEAYHLATDIGPAFDLVFPALDQAERSLIRDGLIRPMVENIAKYKAGKSNWQTWHNAGLLWGGACLGEAKWIDRAISDKGNGFISQMEESVTAEGMWYENSWAYHFYALDGLVAVTEGSRRLGVDLWGHPKLKRMFTIAADYVMADGSLPRFGDDVNSFASQARQQLEAAYHAYQDPLIGALLSEDLDLQSISLGRVEAKQPTNWLRASRTFRAAGHAILRTQGEAGLTAAFTFSPFGGFHGHFDKLSFVLFGYGVELGVDPGRARSQAYGLPAHNNWYRATLGHNAVVVDRNSQKGAGARLELFGATDMFAAVRARTTEAYPGVNHARTLVMTPEYLLVFDDLNADDQSDHRFDWLYHHRGRSVWCPVTSDDARLIDFPGTEFIEHQRTGKTNETLRFRFDGTGTTTWLTVDAQQGTSAMVGDGLGASMDDRVPLAMVTRHGRAVRFAAVIEPVRSQTRRSVDEVTARQVDGGVVVSVKRGALSDTITIESRCIKVRRGAESVLEVRGV